MPERDMRDAGSLAEVLAGKLLDAGLLDAVQLEYARQKHAVHGEALWRIVISEGLAGEKEVVALLSSVLQIEFSTLPRSTTPIRKCCRCSTRNSA